MRLPSLIGGRLTLLILLASAVFFSVLVRPAALITFALVALAGGITIPPPAQR
tara:strand:- start:494 stop:652 length:159 start_codon:yes stop_codon:yes gene_type:complete